MRRSAAAGLEGDIMIIVARVLDLVVGVFGVIFALITPAVARVG